MRSLELAGVIGTWAAAALALIALISIIPIYIGYRRKMTTWAKEIAKVDDPSRDFITKGWPGLTGQRLFSRVHVPNLLEPPDISSIHIERKRFSEFWPWKSQSHTGWVNFLNILRSYNVIGPSSDWDGKLTMVDGEILFPVHRSWILLIGLIDRYSKRRDYGLLSGQSREPQVQLSFSSSALYGLSGVMSERLSSQDEEQRYGLNVICFHMHRLSQIKALSARATAYQPPLQNLVFLYLGYIPNSDGDLYFADSSLEFEKANASRRKTRKQRLWEIKGVEQADLAQYHQDIFCEFQIDVENRRIHILRSRGLSKEEEKAVSDGAVEYYKLSSSYSDSWVWIHRTDANAVLRAAMDVGCNPQSFLYHEAKKKGDLIFRALGRRGLIASITRALGVMNDSNQRPLEAAMNRTLESLDEYRQPGSWSRDLWTKLTELEKKIMSTYAGEKHPSMLAIGVLFALDKDFRLLIKSSDSKPPSDRTPNKLKLDFSGKAVRYPGGDGMDEKFFFLDFATFFGDSPLPEPKDVPYAEVAMACLRSHVIMAMWSMCISADRLSNLYMNLDSIVQVSARTLPRRRHAKRNVEDSIHRIFHPSDQSSNWSEGESDVDVERNEDSDWSDEGFDQEALRYPPKRQKSRTSKSSSDTSSDSSSKSSSRPVSKVQIPWRSKRYAQYRRKGKHPIASSSPSGKPSGGQSGDADSDRSLKNEMLILKKEPEEIEMWQLLEGGSYKNLRTRRKKKKNDKPKTEEDECSYAEGQDTKDGGLEDSLADSNGKNEEKERNEKLDKGLGTDGEGGSEISQNES